MAPSSSIPPKLAPSVEEAYRRKCIQLKARTKEVEEANDAARLRLARLKRQVEKMRLERAFLLEQLSKRTSTNVEDSEGSPSPPPTPQDKPLRSKRGHRKASLLTAIDTAAAPGATFISQNLQNMSPSSDNLSHTHADSQKEPGQKEPRANGTSGSGSGGGSGSGSSKAPKRPSTAFDLYCAETRPTIKNKEGIEEELARGWKDLPQAQKEEFEARYEDELAKYKKAKEDSAAAQQEADPPAAEPPSQAEDTPARDDDVEMNYDTEPERTPAAEKQEE